MLWKRRESEVKFLMRVFSKQEALEVPEGKGLYRLVRPIGETGE